MKLITALDLQPIVDSLMKQEVITIPVTELMQLVDRIDKAESALKFAKKDLLDCQQHIDHFKNKWLTLVEKKREPKSKTSSTSSPSSDSSASSEA